MQDRRSNLKERLLEEVADLQDEQVADLIAYADRLKEESAQNRSSQNQGLDARGITLIWRCMECGYVQDKEEQLPEECPNCGSPKEAFLLIEED